jgi:signal peptidase II
MPRSLPWFGLAALIVAADQIVKWAVLGYFSGRNSVEPLTGFFNLVLACNKGAAFSMLADASGWQGPLFVGFALTAAVVVGALILRHPGKPLFCAGLTLVLGGALGNVIDRVRHGCVVDFLDFHAEFLNFYPFYKHFPAFNVADSAITIGAALLILDGLVFHEKRAGASS